MQADIPQAEIFGVVSDKMAQMSTNLIIVDNYPINQTQFNSWMKCYPLPLLVLFLEIEDTRERKLGRGRPDDTDVSHTTRKLQFERNTIPIISHMGERVVRLDARKSPRELTQESYKVIRQTFINARINLCDQSLLNVERLTELARLPTKALPFAAGFDIYLTKAIVIPAHKTQVHSVSISVEIPARSVGIIYGRSSISMRGVLTHNGVIDPGYSDSLKIILTNLTSDPIFIDNCLAIAQILIFPIYCPQVVENITLKTGRSGFGSTDKSQDGEIHVCK